MLQLTYSRGQSSKTKWFGIKSAKVISVRMDVQFSSFFHQYTKNELKYKEKTMRILKCICLYINPCNTKFIERSNEP